jgi:5'-3' exonuclease
VTQPCEILAIDFLNLLVRAWHTGKPTESHAVRSMWQTVANAVRTLRPRRLVFALDGGHAHRSALLPSYKAHRPPSDPNLNLQKVLAEQAITAAGFCAVRVPEYEADDVLATIASQCTNVVLCSSDKDLLLYSARQRVYHPWKAGAFVTASDVLGVSPAQVTDYLALCGDASDGVPGVPGIGPKTAVSLLTDYGSLEGVFVAAAQGRIKGAVGRKLQSARAEALLSHQLVSLVDTLPLPALHEWRPVDGWQSRLVDLRLGQVAATIDSIADVLLDVPSAVTPAPRDQLQRSITEPIRVGLSVQDLWSGPDRGLISCWESGRRRQGGDNPWRSETLNALAWSQGAAGQDLRIDLVASQAAETQPPRQLDLFG